MRRTVLLLAGALLSVVALGSDSPKEYDDKTEMNDPVEGTWQLTQYELNGERLKLPFQVVMICHDGAITHKRSDGNTPRWNLRIDPARSPRHLDMIPLGGARQSIKCIYQIDGDILRIGYRVGETDRPQGFNEVNVAVQTYKRVK
jgi:uncharacterized protein (TIGR03067 family)